MKKLLLLLLFIPLVSYTQYSKKELRKLKKVNLNIVNRGLDLNATFVVYSNSEDEDYWKYNNNQWEAAMFSKGLDVGDYTYQRQVKDANNREMTLSNSITFNGRYIFDTSSSVLSIKDLQNNNKIVATITFEKLYYPTFGYDYIIEKLIESNK